MKRIIILCTCFLVVCFSSFSQNKLKTAKQQRPEDMVKQFWFVMLTSGTSRTQDSVTVAKLQAGHMANIERLYYEGKLKVAGPFGDNGNWRGIFIFDCETKEEVQNLLDTDPAIAAGRLAYEIHPWYTSPTGSFKKGKPVKKSKIKN
ncbi:MAG: YciI family protein [Ferruginibacter sp.]